MQANKEESVCATKSFTASMASLLMLAYALADKPLDDVSLVTSVETILRHKEQVSALAQRYMLAQNLVILGTGLSYSAAKETALKLKEACYINAWGMSSVDFCMDPLHFEPHVARYHICTSRCHVACQSKRHRTNQTNWCTCARSFR